ncbi:Rop family plasmid primer RNA-binding protein [Staphylococcus aureus]|uniref:Rop family plasmid primer RNA-binding protein n=1 Tax=Staphylococcus aureus TaxID=1280 RepID=UPI003CD02FF1
MQRGKPPEWWEKQKGSRGIRRGQWYRLVFQFPIREQADICESLHDHADELYRSCLARFGDDGENL